MGIGTYNEECRSIVMRYSQEWETIVHRLGRWIDFEVRPGLVVKACPGLGCGAAVAAVAVVAVGGSSLPACVAAVWMPCASKPLIRPRAAPPQTWHILTHTFQAQTPIPPPLEQNDYKTLDPTFMESVWWVFKQLFDKGLVYRGFKASALFVVIFCRLQCCIIIILCYFSAVFASCWCRAVTMPVQPHAVASCDEESAEQF